MFSHFISYISSLLIDNPHATPVEVGTTIEPTPVGDSVIESDIVVKITNVSIV